MEELKVAMGDVGYNWPFIVKESDGRARDLTDYTVAINIWTPGSPTTLLADGLSVTKDDATRGTCYWTLTNIFTGEGVYYGELELTKSGVVENTETFKVVVKESG